MGQRLVINITRKGKRLANAYYHWSGYTSSAFSLMEQVIQYHKENPLPEDTYSNNDYLILAVNALRSTGAKVCEDTCAISPNDIFLMKNNYIKLYGLHKEIITTKEEIEYQLGPKHISLERALKELEETGEHVVRYCELNVNRNDGLICITKGGIEENESYAESLISYDLETKRIDFRDAFWVSYLENKTILSKKEKGGFEYLKIEFDEGTYEFLDAGFPYDICNMTVDQFSDLYNLYELSDGYIKMDDVLFEPIG